LPQLSRGIGVVFRCSFLWERKGISKRSVVSDEHFITVPVLAGSPGY
ncbi:unnamed protein product, partial [marine sediment metagenome]